MVHNSFSVEMSKLYGERLKSMSFRHIMLDRSLKLIICKGLAALKEEKLVIFNYLLILSNS